MKKLKLFLPVFLPGMISFAAAQQLPNKQEVSLRAPTDIKVDGKATEWNNKFHAYNKATQVFYTIANDDASIYLTVQTTDDVIAQKIVTHGLVFTISTAKDKDPVSITFPLMTREEYGRIITNLNTDPARKLTDPTAIAKMSDSLINAMNDQLTNKSKEIEVTGIAAISDQRISVYNEYGVKAVSLFDSKKAYTYEIAIPIKFLGETTGKLNYNIKLKGSPPGNTTTTVSGGYILRSTPGYASVEIKATPRALALVAIDDPTDFSGEYTLAKK